MVVDHPTDYDINLIEHWLNDKIGKEHIDWEWDGAFHLSFKDEKDLEKFKSSEHYETLYTYYKKC